jgi:hypothetical protein
MYQLILRAKDVQKILNVCRTQSYEIIKNLRESYPYSQKLKGSKIRTEDLANFYNLKLEDIEKRLQS